MFHCTYMKPSCQKRAPACKGDDYTEQVNSLSLNWWSLGLEQGKRGILVVTDLLTQWIGLSQLQRVNWTNTKNTTEILIHYRYPWCLLTRNAASSLLISGNRCNKSISQYPFTSQEQIELNSKLRIEENVADILVGKTHRTWDQTPISITICSTPENHWTPQTGWYSWLNCFQVETFADLMTAILTSRKKLLWRSRRMARKNWPGGMWTHKIYKTVCWEEKRFKPRQIVLWRNHNSSSKADGYNHAGLVQK